MANSTRQSAGAGKTVLSFVPSPSHGPSPSQQRVYRSIIINHLQTEYAQNKEIGVVYAYCRYTESYTTAQIYRWWIKELLERSPATFRYVRETFYSHKKQETVPTKSELLEILCNISSAFQKVFIVIDGLDETNDEVKQELLETLDTLPRKARGLIMSRPLPLFKYLLPEAVFIDIEARNEDIELFVAKRIHQIPRLQNMLEGKDSVRSQVYAKIKEKSGGM